MMNEYLQEFIILKKNYEALDGSGTGILARCAFADRLAADGVAETTAILVQVYQSLGQMKSAYQLYSG